MQAMEKTVSDALTPENVVRFPSPNWNERPCEPKSGKAVIDTVILHYTGMQTGQEALERLCSADAEVSAHYLIEENGDIYLLVDPERRAWHAGVSAWQGRHNMNDTSIGIELVNPGHEHGYRAFPECQVERLEALLGYLKARFDIPTNRFVGHSDVSPDRKQDPGELFPWRRLADQGFGVWANCTTKDATIIAKEAMVSAECPALNVLLATIGYSVPQGEIFSRGTFMALSAFQRHWRPSNVDGQLDSETKAVLLEIAEKISR